MISVLSIKIKQSLSKITQTLPLEDVLVLLLVLVKTLKSVKSVTPWLKPKLKRHHLPKNSMNSVNNSPNLSLLSVLPSGPSISVTLTIQSTVVHSSRVPSTISKSLLLLPSLLSQKVSQLSSQLVWLSVPTEWPKRTPLSAPSHLSKPLVVHLLSAPIKLVHSPPTKCLASRCSPLVPLKVKLPSSTNSKSQAPPTNHVVTSLLVAERLTALLTLPLLNSL